jgi:hypothetical protein
MNTMRTLIALPLIAWTVLIAANQSLAAPTFAAGVQVGTVQNSAINEASGLAASRMNSNVLWAHNDSGDSARVFAMTPVGTHLGTYSITGAGATDWEDIAVGPGPAAGSQYLYMGDIGDNNGARASISIYRVPEPAVSATQSPVTTSLSGADRLRFTYPDGPRDAESLFVDPITRDIYILTKRENPKHLYRAPYPQSTTATTTLELVTTYASTIWFTAADISPDGDEIIIRGVPNSTGRLFIRPPGGTIADALNSTPITIPLRTEPQGEAIAFDPNGWGYYTVSEFANQPIYYFDRIAEPGDVNHNGTIDAADYVAMRKTNDTPTAYSTWRVNFAETSTAALGSNVAPEPQSAWIIVAALAALLSNYRPPISS